MSEIKKIKIGNETYNIGVDGLVLTTNEIRLTNSEGFMISDKNHINYLMIDTNSVAIFENCDFQVSHNAFKLDDNGIRFTSHTGTITVTIDPEYGVLKFANGYELRGTTTSYFSDNHEYLLSDMPIVVDNSKRLGYIQANTLNVTRIKSTSKYHNIELIMDFDGVRFVDYYNNSEFKIPFTTSSTSSSSSSSSSSSTSSTSISPMSTTTSQTTTPPTSSSSTMTTLPPTTTTKTTT